LVSAATVDYALGNLLALISLAANSVAKRVITVFVKRANDVCVRARCYQSFDTRPFFFTAALAEHPI
jgi:hypothetical protein